MKILLFTFAILLFSNASVGQVYRDTCDNGYIFHSGILAEKALDSGTYSYGVSDQYCYIEFVLPFFGESNAIYRVERVSKGDVYLVTKTYLTNEKSNATCFLAINAGMAEKWKKLKKKYLKKSKIYEDIITNESIIFDYISRYISKHGLQNYFLNFDFSSFVAWLKIKT